jgi:hypothetical protein
MVKPVLQTLKLLAEPPPAHANETICSIKTYDHLQWLSDLTYAVLGAPHWLFGRVRPIHIRSPRRWLKNSVRRCRRVKRGNGSGGEFDVTMVDCYCMMMSVALGLGDSPVKAEKVPAAAGTSAPTARSVTVSTCMQVSDTPWLDAKPALLVAGLQSAVKKLLSSALQDLRQRVPLVVPP